MTKTMKKTKTRMTHKKIVRMGSSLEPSVMLLSLCRMETTLKCVTELTMTGKTKTLKAQTALKLPTIVPLPLDGRPGHPTISLSPTATSYIFQLDASLGIVLWRNIFDKTSQRVQQKRNVVDSSRSQMMIPTQWKMVRGKGLQRNRRLDANLFLGQTVVWECWLLLFIRSVKQELRRSGNASETSEHRHDISGETRSGRICRSTIAIRCFSRNLINWYYNLITKFAIHVMLSSSKSLHQAAAGAVLGFRCRLWRQVRQRYLIVGRDSDSLSMSNRLIIGWART